MIIEPRAIAIIASREDVPTLKNCIDSVIRAVKGSTAVIDVLVNGNAQLAREVAQLPFSPSPECTLRIWNIKQGDKAHAWNEYLHHIWPGEGDAFFLDGYVEVDDQALNALASGLMASEAAWGATGVPTSGRSAARLRAQMLREGGFHGNLNVIRAHAMEKLRASGFRLPLGLYRTDSLIGALLMFGLDSATNSWDTRRILVEPNAVWKVRGIEKLTYRNVVSQWKRTLRQAQGVLENRAVREHLAVKRLAPHLLPATTHELVNRWISAQRDQARSLFRSRPLCAYAAWKMKTPRDWSATAVAPELMADIGHA